MVPHYEAARAYADRGWTLLPMMMSEKKPRVRWKRYQRHPPSDGTLRNWFRDSDHGVGVIFGAASGGLASRDFDTRERYEAWTRAQPTLAAELPTVATRRGFHVYCNAWAESVTEARRRLGKALDGTGAIDAGDGELRAGVGCYSVLPPSTHPSGHVYGWSVPLSDTLPTIDVCEVDFVDFDSCNSCHRENRDNREYRDNRSKNEIVDDETTTTPKNATLTAEEAITITLPTAPGHRHRQVFEFARALKAVPSLADADGAELRGYVEAWHRRALPCISTLAFEETWADFLMAWPKVQFPRGAEPMAAIFERACSTGIPAAAERYEGYELHLLVAICRELQRAAGDGPFYLSCRTAGALIGVDAKTANRWLIVLVADRVLELVKKGGPSTRKANRYRYRGDL